ncbi:MAG: YbfB/YjiJ family MFS transporter [Bradyrhizobiaceae bacterium]|nr:MAG: YbfB/YjiJ family MFS transporter [Bradyrhizobiaceae bacterium]
MSHPALAPGKAWCKYPARTLTILAFATAIGLGMGRFAYSLVLPDMRESLGWSYATAGSMNTINAIGYMIGAFLAAPLAARVGLLRAVWTGTTIAIISLAASAVSGHVAPFAVARLLSGTGAAFALVCGGALGAAIAQYNPARASVLIGIFYIGPGIGIAISGCTAPFLLQEFGPGSWWIVWTAMTAIALVLAVPLFLTRVDVPAPKQDATEEIASLRPIVLYLVSYFLFGAGYIAYMTFMIAYIRDAGGDAYAQSLFWCLIGLGGITSPWTWAPLVARGRSGLVMGLTIGVAGVGAVLALIATSTWVYAISALLFGSGILAVVTALTAFARFNYPPAQWSKVIGAMTIAFSIGQIVGPVITGAITDYTGSLTSALTVSAAALLLGAVVGALQRPLRTAAP